MIFRFVNRTCANCYLYISATCYKKTREETQAIQDKIEAELGLDPVDKTVVVLYDGEKQEQVMVNEILFIESLCYSDSLKCEFSFHLQPVEFFEGKRVVEMEKPRPAWFGRNLLQKTTQPAATTKDIKPSELG